jgi:hypothetical protein
MMPLISTPKQKKKKVKTTFQREKEASVDVTHERV